MQRRRNWIPIHLINVMWLPLWLLYWGNYADFRSGANITYVIQHCVTPSRKAMECEEGIYRVWRRKDQISLGSRSDNDDTPSRSSTEPSPEASQISIDDRLLPINRVIPKYTAFCVLQDNLQTAHYMLLKAKQQTRELFWSDIPVPQKLNDTIQSLVEVLHMTADFKYIHQELELAKNDLLIPSVSRELDLSPGVDEELHDTRENCFPRSP